MVQSEGAKLGSRLLTQLPKLWHEARCYWIL